METARPPLGWQTYAAAAADVPVKIFSLPAACAIAPLLSDGAGL